MTGIHITKLTLSENKGIVAFAKRSRVTSSVGSEVIRQMNPSPYSSSLRSDIRLPSDMSGIGKAFGPK